MPKKKKRSRKASKTTKRTPSRKATKKAISRPAKKKSGKKRKVLSSRSKRPMFRPAGAQAFAAVSDATTAACLPEPDAIDLVFSCPGVPEDTPLSAKLGDLFPDPKRRDRYCQCVAEGVPTERSNVPCSSSTTLQAVVDAIKCED